jgi:hypothetical protein
MDTAVSAEATTQGPKVPTKGMASPKGRNIKYPVQLRVNITPEMNASLARVARHFDMPEAMVGRMALKQFLASSAKIRNFVST